MSVNQRDRDGSQPLPAPLPESMLEEAAVWQARLRGVVPGSADAQRVGAGFRQWVSADRRRLQAFAEMESVWGALEWPVAGLLAEQDAAAGESTQGRRSRPFGKAPVPFKGLAVAASLLLVLLVSVGWQRDWLTHWQSDYVTGVGEQAPVALADGSQVLLNTDSALVLDYSATERRVRLLKGEAWFQVSADAGRPFIVETDEGTVRVTGTRFNVRLTDRSAVVSLEQGRVVLRAPSVAGSTPGAKVVLAPGQQAGLADHRIGTPTPFDNAAVSAWRRGQLVFYDTPLSEVVAALNRYRPGRILITREALNRVRVSGVFSSTDPDAALAVLTRTLPVDALHLTDYLILLR